ncbi:hypothetical protein [Streptomyces luteireticuli]|uniref:hypothetical protein n=1 Tax=Streptomyces luteireticuli TaxID=173858 RepID=UPI003555BEA5
MTELRKRLLPTGECFCGCGGEAEIGRWFVRGHDITAGAALRAVEGVSLPQRLVDAGFGPGRSVVAQAVEQAGWARCAGCAYAGPAAGLAAHVRGSGCAAEDQAEAESESGPEEPAVARELAGDENAPAAGELSAQASSGGRRRRDRAGEDAGPVRAEAGPARGLLLPGPDDEVWKQVPLHLRQNLSNAAYRLVTPEQAVLREKGNRGVRFALRAAGQKRLSGRHWHALLTAPRESFGSARSERAQKAFAVLEEVVAEYLAPAIEGNAADGAEDSAVEAPAG